MKREMCTDAFGGVPHVTPIDAHFLLKEITLKKLEEIATITKISAFMQRGEEDYLSVKMS